MPPPVEELHAEIERLRARVALFDDMLEGIQIFDPDLRYLYVNRAAARHGRTTTQALLGRTLAECYPGVEQTELFDRLKRVIGTGVPELMENLFEYPDGSKAWFELRMEPISEGLLLLSIDIDQRRRLEEQLRHAQKMEAIGRMAGGIAHDFNNLLTVVTAYVSFMSESLPPESPLVDDLRHVSEAADRGAKLTHQLLALGRRQVTQPRVVRVREALRALEPLLDRMLGDDVRLDVVYGRGACAIRIDPGQLDQIVLNLCTNARDAMPDGGALTVRVEEVYVDARYAERHLGLEPGDYVQLTVADTGIGMDDTTMAHIFEPFFTTKGPGRGTGLGLATSHGIVSQAGGQIRVFSQPGSGTTFKVFFPRVDPEDGARTGPHTPPPTDLGGTETILVVDDDPALREVCVRSLTHLGYTVLEAEGVDDAIHLASRYSDAIHAMVADVVLQDGRGPALYARLAAQRPHLHALYMSGYADPEHLRAIDPRTFVEKPFTPDTLARRLRQVLGPSAEG